jgi:integrase
MQNYLPLNARKSQSSRSKPASKSGSYQERRTNLKRKRQQEGNIFKARGVWYVRYFDTRVIDGEVKRVRVAKQIANVREKINGVLTTITKAKARDLAKPTLNKANQPDRSPETAVSLVDFVERVYLPRMQQQKRPSTVKGYRDIWANHLRCRSAGLWMREIRTCDIQRILDEIARPGTLSGNSLRHIKSQISGIFSYAKQQGYFDGENPARNTAIPPARLSEETYAYSLEEIGQILSVLSEPAATVFAVAAFTGARRGEIRGLMWENYHDSEIQITRSIWRGHISEPKTRKSRGAIPVIAPLAKRLELHRTRSGDPQAGVMFPNLSGSPMDLGNLLNRAILPALNRCAVCEKPREECGKLFKEKDTGPDHNFERDKILPEWHGWHAARRGLGTNLYRLGVPEKTIQAILRHANVSTTNTYYIKSAADDTRAAMAKLERLVIGNESPAETVQREILTTGNELATDAADANTAAIQ